MNLVMRTTRLERELVALTLISKVLLFGAGWIGYVTYSDHWGLTGPEIYQFFAHWDAQHYMQIATQGYGPTGEPRIWLAFYPLYPYAIYLLRPFFGAEPAGLLISAIASAVLAVVLFRLVRLDYDEDAAQRSVWFMLIFPTAIFLHLVYTDALFVLLVVASFLMARRERWLAAGIYGALAALTHDTGVVLAAALGVEALYQLNASRRWDSRRLWALLPLAGFAGVLLVDWITSGNPLAFIEQEGGHWGNKMGVPWAWYGQLALINWMSPQSAITLGVIVPIFAAFGLAAGVASFFVLRPSYAVWCLLNALIFAMQTWDMGTPRFDLVLFPVFILEALAARNWLMSAILTLGSVLLLGLFSDEYFKGHWAF